MKIKNNGEIREEITIPGTKLFYIKTEFRRNNKLRNAFYSATITVTGKVLKLTPLNGPGEYMKIKLTYPNHKLKKYKKTLLNII